MKKLLAVLLAVLMITPAFSMQSFAIDFDFDFNFDIWGDEDDWEEDWEEDDYWEDYIDFESDGILYSGFADELSVTVYGYTTEAEEGETEELVIPAEVTYEGETYTVTSIGEDAFVESHYSKITLPETINYIGSYAFWYSAMLEEIIIPESCEFYGFGVDVFAGTLAEGKFFEKDVNIIGQNVLYSYTGAEKTFEIPENITILAPACFMYTGIEEVVFNEYITEIPDFAFCGCRNLKEIEIPDTIYYVGEAAFKDCANLEEVTLGEKVTYLGIACFSNTKIETLHLGAEVINADGAFMNCPYLQEVTVSLLNEYFYADENALYNVYTYYDEECPAEIDYEEIYLVYYFGKNTDESFTVSEDVNYISDYAFYNCKTLKHINMPDVFFIGAKAFANSSLENFDLKTEYSDCFVGQAAFNNCKNLKKADLTHADTIDYAAFENCTSLEKVTLNEDVLCIDGLAFSNTALESVEIYGNESYIGEDIFKGCKNLKTVVFGDGVWWIDSNVIRDCEKIETVYLSKTIEEFGENAFQNCEHVTFEVIKYSDAYDYIKDSGYNYEIVGKIPFFERVIKFFEWLFEQLFGWMYF